jgi:hypothetical protein
MRLVCCEGELPDEMNTGCKLTWSGQILLLEWLALSSGLGRNGVHFVAVFEGSCALWYISNILSLTLIW